MREPNFSESQLQQAINTACIRFIFEKTGDWSFAHVPSLFDEFELGWDSAFYLWWLNQPPNPDHEGCNFFIQYKLSGLLTSAGAKEWAHWNSEYFRFKIPHSTRDASGSFVDDYHQWDKLKALANQGYPTYYATNSTLCKDDLQRAYKAGTLLTTTPALDVRSIAMQHKHVTFADGSTHFKLHSEKEELEMASLSGAIFAARKMEASSLSESVERLLESLERVGGDNGFWRDDLERIQEARRSASSEDGAIRAHIMLSSFMRKHVGTIMLWLPKNSGE